jgi:hypothetical protein
MTDAQENQLFRIHLEYGHYEHYLYWGFDLIQIGNELHLDVRRDDGTNVRIPLGSVSQKSSNSL